MRKLSYLVVCIMVFSLCSSASATAFSDAVNALNPVGYWEFESAWTDTTANANTLTPFGTAAFTAGPGLPGLGASAGDFRHPGGHQGAYVATGVANALNLSAATAYTINAWVSNDEDWGTWGFIAVERDTSWSGGFNYGFSHYNWAGGPTSGYRGWNNNLPSAEGLTLQDTGWHMLTASITLGGTANFYVDGVFAGSDSSSGSTIAGDGAWFGVANPINPDSAAGGDGWTSNDLNGRIDELAVFGSALTGPQISDLYDAAFVSVSPTFWLTSQSDGTLDSNATLNVVAGGTVTLYAYIDTDDSGNTFELMVGYDRSDANTFGLTGNPVTNNLSLVSTLADVNNSINAMFTVGRTANLGSGREDNNSWLGGRPYGLQVYGGFPGESVIGKQQLCSFTIQNDMATPGQESWVVISDAEDGASFTSAWKRGILSKRGSYQLKILTVAAPVCGDYGYPTGDVSGSTPGVSDCTVNFLDFSYMASGYPTTYTLTNIAELTANWLECTDPQSPCNYNP